MYIIPIILTAPTPPPCVDGELRLFGGDALNEGTIEVCQSGQWNGGTICDDFWDTSEAMVVCRQLGFQSEGKFYTWNIYSEQHIFCQIHIKNVCTVHAVFHALRHCVLSRFVESN